MTLTFIDPILVEMDDDALNKLSNQKIVEMGKAYNDAAGLLAGLSYFRYNLLIYRIITKGLISKAEVSRLTGLSESQLYNIITNVEKELENE